MSAQCERKPHALILARGGSKGIPKKNIKPLNGVPLLVYNVKAALASGVFGAVVVSSDDEEILKVARKAGALGHARSAASASDTASSEAGIFDYLDAHPECEVCCLVQCTSPLTGEEDFREAYSKFVAAKADSLVTAVRTHRFPHPLTQPDPTNSRPGRAGTKGKSPGKSRERRHPRRKRGHHGRVKLDWEQPHACRRRSSTTKGRPTLSGDPKSQR